MQKLILIITSILLFSCSSKHHIHINSDDSANISFNVKNKDSLIETLKDWGAVQEVENDSVIDIDLIQSELANDPNIDNVDIKSSSKNSYDGTLFVTDINNLFENSTNEIPKELQIFSLTKKNNQKTLKIMLSLENYIYLKNSLPILQNESIDMLGPDSNQDVTKEEYLDMMSFSLGDDGPKDILSSNIELKITVDGSITDITGGEIIDSKSCLFKVPLIDIILLKDKLTYSVTYK